MQNKILFFFLFIIDIVSTYKLLGAFNSSLSRLFGLSACLFFINAILILWMKYLIHQPKEIQKEIFFKIADRKGVVDCSLYDILNNSWSRLKKAQILYNETIFSLFVFLLVLWITFVNIIDGADIFLELKNAFALSLLPYYFGFCFNSITVIVMAFIQNEKNNGIALLRREFIIKLIQAMFIAVLYGIGPVFPLIVLTSFFRLYADTKK